MNILNVNHTIDEVSGGGTAERTFKMSLNLIQRGFTCTILTMDHGNNIRVLPGGCIVALPLISKRFSIPRFLFRGIPKLVDEADIIHIMGHWTILNALVYLVARYKKKPYVFCPAGALPIFGRSKLLKLAYNAIIGNVIVRDAMRYIAITEQEKTSFKKYAIDDRYIVTIPNAVSEPNNFSHSDIYFRNKFNLGDRPFVLFLGRLNIIKGPDLLLHAFCQLKDIFNNFDLVFAGPDDGMLSLLNSVVEKYNAQDVVHFIGHLNAVDKFQAFRSSTLLAIPSRQEAMSLVVLEAGIVGVPSIFTDQCGLDELAKSGCGWMVPASIEGLKQGLTDSLSNPTHIIDMQEKIKDAVVNNFSWDAIMKKYIKMYDEISKEKF